MDREQQLERLKSEKFDVLVIGGGATGAGIALDAALRGLRVGLVERQDFSSGTSSRSTKLIHGGVRYLEQAVLKFDRSQFRLVRDALKERSTLIKIAPHLVHPLPILTPLYRWSAVPYYLAGLKLYDRLAGSYSLNPSHFIDTRTALKQFPQLKSKGLRGGVVYYDGQFDDARMNISLVLSAAEYGAATANYVSVSGFEKVGGQLSAAHVRDELTTESWKISSKVFINATGPFVDAVRKMDDPGMTPMLNASSGVHIVLDKKFCPPQTGLLIPKTEDDRVLFLLPWLNHTLVGTTDNPAAIESDPIPAETDIQFILNQLNKYFASDLKRGDVLSTWCGLRPLVSNPRAHDTARLSRDHIIHTSDGGLITIAGGKWTTYRKMASDAVNEAVRFGELPAGPCKTDSTRIAGGDRFSPGNVEVLRREYHLEADVAAYLNRAYGDRSTKIAQLARSGFSARLIPQHPHLHAEVVYCAKEEGARRALDFIARRSRLAFIDSKQALKAASVVVDLMGEVFDWNADRRREEIQHVRQNIFV